MGIVLAAMVCSTAEVAQTQHSPRLRALKCARMTLQQRFPPSSTAPIRAHIPRRGVVQQEAQTAVATLALASISAILFNQMLRRL